MKRAPELDADLWQAILQHLNISERARAARVCSTTRYLPFTDLRFDRKLNTRGTPQTVDVHGDAEDCTRQRTRVLHVQGLRALQPDTCTGTPDFKAEHLTQLLLFFAEWIFLLRRCGEAKSMKKVDKGIRGDTAAFQKAVAVLSRESDHGPAARLPRCGGPIFLQMVNLSMACQKEHIAGLEASKARLKLATGHPSDADFDFGFNWL